MKIAEQKSSTKNAARTPYCADGTVAALATSSLDVISSSPSAASTAPANCAIQ